MYSVQRLFSSAANVLKKLNAAKAASEIQRFVGKVVGILLG